MLPNMRMMRLMRPAVPMASFSDLASTRKPTIVGMATTAAAKTMLVSIHR
jgi:hypothetical protein